MIRKLKRRSGRKNYFSSVGSSIGYGHKAQRKTVLVKRARRGKFTVRKHK